MEDSVLLLEELGPLADGCQVPDVRLAADHIIGSYFVGPDVELGSAFPFLSSGTSRSTADPEAPGFLRSGGRFPGGGVGGGDLGRRQLVPLLLLLTLAQFFDAQVVAVEGPRAFVGIVRVLEALYRLRGLFHVLRQTGRVLEDEVHDAVVLLALEVEEAVAQRSDVGRVETHPGDDVLEEVVLLQRHSVVEFLPVQACSLLLRQLGIFAERLTKAVDDDRALP